MSKSDLSPDLIRRLFEYRDGALIWRVRPLGDFVSARACAAWNARWAGKQAGYINRVRSGDRRRVSITVGGAARRYYTSRLVWVWHHRKWPAGIIDHEDGNTLNDRIKNLRDVPESVNSKNARIHIDNSTGTLGVYRAKGRGRWKAEIMADGCKRHLGVFDTFEEAAAARKSAERSLGFHENHGRAS